MNIETKEVYFPSEEKKTAQIALMKQFGWQYTKDTSHMRSGWYAVYARDKDMPNYRLIAALEAKYFMLESKKKTYNSMDPTLCILLFLLLVIPLIVYVGFKASQQERFAAHNANIESQQKGILKEVATLL